VKPRLVQSAIVLLFLCAAVGLLVAGCSFGGGNDTPSTSTMVPTGDLSSQAGQTEEAILLGAQAFSTFKSKDPFIQQAVASSTTSTSEGGSTGTTSPGGTTTTHISGTTSTTYKPGTTTTTKPPATTTTTAPHTHLLKILSVGVVGGGAAVTFQVDNSVYKDKRVGDVVSTSWGQVKVLDLSTSSKVATLLHGSETLVLTVGQVIYE